MPGVGTVDGNRFFINAFDWEMEQQIVPPLVAQVKKQLEVKDPLIELWINSFGGYTHILFNIVEILELAKANDIVVRTIVSDLAASCGSLLAVVGTPGERYIARGARHLAHYGWSPMSASTPLQAKREFDDTTNHFARIKKHYEKYCDIPDLDEKIADDSWWITATQAVKWGMADKYMEKLPLV